MSTLRGLSMVGATGGCDGSRRANSGQLLGLLGVLAGAALVACSPTIHTVRPIDFPSAIDLTGTPLAAETYEGADLLHLRYILEDRQAEAYARMSPEERREMLRLVWAALDPTPTTPRDERKEAHYRRLACVRENFRIRDEPGWDLRGELLLRYGSPQVREIIQPDVVPGFGLVPPREVWIYSWLGMTFRLADALLGDNFQEDAGRAHSSRPDIAYGSDPVDAPSGAVSTDVGGARRQPRPAGCRKCKGRERAPCTREPTRSCSTTGAISSTTSSTRSTLPVRSRAERRSR